MLIVHVTVKVKPSHIEDFVHATRVNAEASRKEAGIVRFDVVQSVSDAEHFVLIEIYRDDAAPALHKETAHYAAWRTAVEPWMAEPRKSEKFRAVSPLDASSFESK